MKARVERQEDHLYGFFEFTTRLNEKNRRVDAATHKGQRNVLNGTAA